MASGESRTSDVRSPPYSYYDIGVNLSADRITVEREGRKYYVYSEDFPGVYGIGKTRQEAKAGFLDTMRIYIRECRGGRLR